MMTTGGGTSGVGERAADEGAKGVAGGWTSIEVDPAASSESLDGVGIGT
jgi:hypothetical protein